jgi:hypothetical protein
MIKLPRTLHIEGSRLPKGAVDPEAIQFPKLAGEFLVIEEKVDGTGVSIFFDANLNLQIWHRGSPALGKEFRVLHNWAKLYEMELYAILEERYVLFGEWMAHKHSIFYDTLPDLFLESDIYDRKENLWLSTMARNFLLTGYQFIHQVPVLAALKPNSLNQIISLIGKPKYQSDKWRLNLWNSCEKSDQPLDKILKESDQSGLMEGLYIKHEDDRQVVGRYKYVRYEFLETILNSGSHLIDREPVSNLIFGSI